MAQYWRFGWWMDPDDVFGKFFAVALAALQLVGTACLAYGTG